MSFIAYKRILTMQDISCVGQCSMTVALPILSACGHETCILPTAVLSSHTAFSSPAITDLTSSIEPICQHWLRENIRFDAIYTGYLGSIREIQMASGIFDFLGNPDCRIIIDPAMADGGKLYSGFDQEYVSAMTELCGRGHVIIPNITEACLMTGTPYREQYDHAFIEGLLADLRRLGAGSIVLTGVGYEPGKTGVAVCSGEKTAYYSHPRLGKSYHGTGDIFASAFVGAWMQGESILEASQTAADFVVSTIAKTQEDPAHWYGVKFEAVLGQLTEKFHR